jgi:hypothetical protein
MVRGNIYSECLFLSSGFYRFMGQGIVLDVLLQLVLLPD